MTCYIVHLSVHLHTPHRRRHRNPIKMNAQSLKQRLGKGNIQARLGRPVGAMMRGGAIGGRGAIRGMIRGGLRGRGRGGVLRGALALRGVFHFHSA